jgi:hypothetical protein
MKFLFFLCLCFCFLAAKGQESSYCESLINEVGYGKYSRALEEVKKGNACNCSIVVEHPSGNRWFPFFIIVKVAEAIFGPPSSTRDILCLALEQHPSLERNELISAIIKCRKVHQPQLPDPMNSFLVNTKNEKYPHLMEEVFQVSGYAGQKRGLSKAAYLGNSTYIEFFVKKYGWQKEKYTLGEIAIRFDTLALLQSVLDQVGVFPNTPNGIDPYRLMEEYTRVRYDNFMDRSVFSVQEFEWFYSALKQKGWSPFVKTSAGKSMMHVLVIHRYSDLVEWLLKEEKWDLNKQDEFGNTLLHEAAKAQDMKICSLFLSYGAKWEIKNKNAEQAWKLVKEENYPLYYLLNGPVKKIETYNTYLLSKLAEIPFEKLSKDQKHVIDTIFSGMRFEFQIPVSQMNYKTFGKMDLCRIAAEHGNWYLMYKLAPLTKDCEYAHFNEQFIDTIDMHRLRSWEADRYLLHSSKLAAYRYKNLLENHLRKQKSSNANVDSLIRLFQLDLIKKKVDDEIHLELPSGFVLMKVKADDIVAIENQPLYIARTGNSVRIYSFGGSEDYANAADSIDLIYQTYGDWGRVYFWRVVMNNQQWIWKGDYFLSYRTKHRVAFPLDADIKYFIPTSGNDPNAIVVYEANKQYGIFSTNEYSGIADQKALYDDIKLLPNKWFALRKNDKWCIRDVMRNQQTEFEFVDVKVEGKKIFTAKKIFGRKKWKEFNP